MTDLLEEGAIYKSALQRKFHPPVEDILLINMQVAFCLFMKVGYHTSNWIHGPRSRQFEHSLDAETKTSPLCSLSFSLSFGIQDDHRLSTSELEKKYGTSISEVSAHGITKKLPESVCLWVTQSFLEAVGKHSN